MKYVNGRENFIEDLMPEQKPSNPRSIWQVVHGVERTGIYELYKPGFESWLHY